MHKVLTLHVSGTGTGFYQGLSYYIFNIMQPLLLKSVYVLNFLWLGVQPYRLSPGNGSAGVYLLHTVLKILPVSFHPDTRDDIFLKTSDRVLHVTENAWSVKVC